MRISDYPPLSSIQNSDEVVIRRGTSNYRVQVDKLPGAETGTEQYNDFKRVHYVSTSTSITDHADSSQAGSLADIITNHVAGNDATVELPGNKIYQIKQSLNIPATVGLRFQLGAIIDTDISIRSTNYQWTASGLGTNEYYLEASGGGNPGVNEPDRVTENENRMTKGTAGSLAACGWAWGDNDSLGYNTVYVRLSDGADPDTKSDGYLQACYSVSFSSPGVVQSGVQQIFRGGGSVSGLLLSCPEWFGDISATTDCSSAVQLALDACANGGTIIFGQIAGVGRSGWAGLSLSGKNDISIIGSSQAGGLRILQQPSQTIPEGSAKAVLKLSSCNRLRLTGMNIDGNSVNAVLICLENVSDSIIEKNYLHDTGNADASGVFAVGGERNKYLANTAYNCGRGLWIGNAAISGHEEKRSIIAGNICDENNATGIAGHFDHCVLKDNICRNNQGSGIAISASTNFQSQHVVVTGNCCTGNLWQGIQSDAYIDTYTKFCNLTGNDCSENGISGIYAVNVLGWVINGNICRNNERGLTIGYYAQKLTISGNLFVDDRAGSNRTQKYGVRVNADYYANTVKDITICGNTCNNHLENGISVTQLSGKTLERVVISGNLCTDNGQQGIMVVDSVAGEMHDIMIGMNYCYNNGIQDIRVDSTITALIADNWFSTELETAYNPLSANDATPSVKGRRHWRTANTSATTITNFDDGIKGQRIVVKINDNNTTIDFSGSNLRGNGGTDWNPSSGDWMEAEFDGTYWLCAVHEV